MTTDTRVEALRAIISTVNTDGEDWEAASSVCVEDIGSDQEFFQALECVIGELECLEGSISTALTRLKELRA